jgi:hypothetical protein
MTPIMGRIHIQIVKEILRINERITIIPIIIMINQKKLHRILKPDEKHDS